MRPIIFQNLHREDRDYNLLHILLRAAAHKYTIVVCLTLIYSFPIIMTAQDGGPLSGSGSIFGGSVVNYSTILYHQEAIELDREERREIKGVEKTLHGRRKARLKRSDRMLKLKFHNYSSLRASEFRKEVDIQVSALERDFTVDAATYYDLTGEEEPRPNDLQIFQFVVLGNNYNPSEEEWKDWDTFTEDNGGPRDRISVFVVEHIPERLGHGYAQYGWINRPGSADIIIRAKSFGSGSGDFTEGDVLTHLLANYLGLQPLTGPGSCEDDGVADTPIHNTALNFCWDREPPTSLCDNQYMLPTNFMAHTPDRCKSTFTIGQWKRMLYMLNYIIQKQER